MSDDGSEEMYSVTSSKTIYRRSRSRPLVIDQSSGSRSSFSSSPTPRTTVRSKSDEGSRSKEYGPVTKWAVDYNNRNYIRSKCNKNEGHHRLIMGRPLDWPVEYDNSFFIRSKVNDLKGFHRRVPEVKRKYVPDKDDLADATGWEFDYGPEFDQAEQDVTYIPEGLIVGRGCYRWYGTKRNNSDFDFSEQEHRENVLNEELLEEMKYGQAFLQADVPHMSEQGKRQYSRGGYRWYEVERNPYDIKPEHEANAEQDPDWRRKHHCNGFLYMDMGEWNREVEDRERHVTKGKPFRRTILNKVHELRKRSGSPRPARYGTRMSLMPGEGQKTLYHGVPDRFPLKERQSPSQRQGFKKKTDKKKHHTSEASRDYEQHEAEELSQTYTSRMRHMAEEKRKSKDRLGHEEEYRKKGRDGRNDEYAYRMQPTNVEMRKKPAVPEGLRKEKKNRREAAVYGEDHGYPPPKSKKTDKKKHHTSEAGSDYEQHEAEELSQTYTSRKRHMAEEKRKSRGILGHEEEYRERGRDGRNDEYSYRMQPTGERYAGKHRTEERGKRSDMDEDARHSYETLRDNVEMRKKQAIAEGRRKEKENRREAAVYGEDHGYPPPKSKVLDQRSHKKKEYSHSDYELGCSRDGSLGRTYHSEETAKKSLIAERKRETSKADDHRHHGSKGGGKPLDEEFEAMALGKHETVEKLPPHVQERIAKIRQRMERLDDNKTNHHRTERLSGVEAIDLMKHKGHPKDKGETHSSQYEKYYTKDGRERWLKREEKIAELHHRDH